MTTTTENTIGPTQQIEETTLKGLDTFFTKLTEAADVVTQKLIEVTPEAADAILNLVQFKGIFELSTGFLVFIIPLGLVLWSWLKFKKYVSCTTGSNFCGEIAVLWLGGNIITTIITIIAFISVLDFYNWLSAFYPEGAIAFKALEAVGINL